MTDQSQSRRRLKLNNRGGGYRMFPPRKVNPSGSDLFSSTTRNNKKRKVNRTNDKRNNNRKELPVSVNDGGNSGNFAGAGSYKHPTINELHQQNQNWKVNRAIDKMTNNNRKELPDSVNDGSNSGNVAGTGSYKHPTINKLQQQNRLKVRRQFSKKKFNNYGGKSAPYAPRNTSSFLIRAKKSGGITLLVSRSPVTPAVLPTPMFSPSSEVLIDTAKEEWGVDGYGSMTGLIRLRSPGNDEGEECVSSESDVEECVEVERRLDHDLSRFEMIYPNYSVNDHKSCVLENRVDDQDTHIAQLEEQNLMLKERLLFIESGFNSLRSRLQSLETRREGAQGLMEEVVENDFENEASSEVLEGNNR